MVFAELGFASSGARMDGRERWRTTWTWVRFAHAVVDRAGFVCCNC